jgi:hypothetical protein
MVKGGIAMRLEQLEYILKTAETESITAAALELIFLNLH